MILEKLFGLKKAEERTKRLKKLFPSSEDLTKEQIFERLQQKGFIKQGFLGRLKGEYFFRVIHPLKEGDTIGYYFNKYEGKYHLTYAGGSDF